MKYNFTNLVVYYNNKNFEKFTNGHLKIDKGLFFVWGKTKQGFKTLILPQTSIKSVEIPAKGCYSDTHERIVIKQL